MATSTVQDVKSCAIQPFNGNAIAFTLAHFGILDIGDLVTSTATKGNVTYAAVNENNEEGYILAINSSLGKLFQKYEPSVDFSPLVIFTSEAVNYKYL